MPTTPMMIMVARIKPREKSLRFHAVLLDRLPSVLFFRRSCKGVATATISFIFPLLSLM